MSARIRGLVRRILYKLLPRSTRFQGFTLPARHLRFCGPEFRDDAYFLASAEAEAQRLESRLGLSRGSRLLDIGCGAGRLPLGILRRLGAIRLYCGVDVRREVIDWCDRYIAREHPSFRFAHLDLQNPRYNPDGERMGRGFKLPFEDHGFDIVYLFSVFSHLTSEDVQTYLHEFQRLLAPEGKIFLTAFVEEGVEEVTENPEGYGKAWTGPLHCVRYDRSYLTSLLQDAGFRIDRLDPRAEVDGQSGLYLSREG